MNSVKNLNLILLAFSLLASNAVKSQATPGLLNKYYVEHFGDDEGLPQNSVNSMLPDANGFLWVATESGIARFNGNRFIPVAFKKGVNSGSFSRIKSFYIKGDTIMAYAAASHLVAFIVNNEIVGVETQFYPKHGIFFLNQHKPLPAPQFLLKDYSTKAREQWNTGQGIYNGTTYNKDTFLVILNDGLGIYNDNGLVNKIKIDSINNKRMVYVNNRALYLDNKNYINCYAASGLQWRQPLPIKSGHAIGIFNNSFESNFFCVADSVLYRVDVSTLGELHVEKILDNLQSPDDITTVYQKDNNTIVTGTLRAGLYVYKRKYFTVTDVLPNGQSDIFYVQQLLSDNKTIFTGNNKLFNESSYLGQTKQLLTTHPYSSLKDSKGNYWYAYKGNVLSAKEIGVAADTLLHFKGSAGVFFEDKSGRVFYSCAEQLGYFINKKFTEVKITNLNPGLISYIEQDANGRYLLATREGLFILKSINDNAVQEMPAFHSMDIRFLWPEANGQVWVCTYGHGFFLIKNDSVTSFTEGGGSLAYAHYIIEDGSGNFWLPTNNGLFVTTRQSLMAYVGNKTALPYYYEFSKKNGFRTNEFNGGTEPAYLRLPNGDISLASMEGLVSFNPATINFNFSSSPILIDNIQIDSSEIMQRDRFEIGANVKNISFTISHAFWGESTNEELQYKLVEQNAEAQGVWLQVDASGKINIFSPSYGKYQLLIRKRKGLKPDDFLYKPINFTVLPRWYQTTTFFICRAIFFGLLLTGIFFWRRNYYRRSNRILKEKVSAATSELQQINNTLERKVEERTAAIQEAEKKFRDLVEKSLVGVYIIKDGKFAYVNPRFAEMFGYTQREITDADSVNIIVHHADREKVATNIRLRMTNEIDGIHYEVKGIRKDGKLVDTELFGRATLFEGGPAIIGTLLDITGRKVAEEQLIKEKDLSQSIINSLPGVFFIFDQQRTHQLWNRNYEIVTGYNSEELKTKMAGTCIEENDLALFTQAIEKMYTAGNAELEVTLINKDKKKIPFYVNGIAITYNNKPCILGIGIDISERKRAEYEREHANYLLNERVKELTTLYRAGMILQSENRPIVVILQDFVSILPTGWQYQHITAACVTLGEMQFCTPNFRNTAYAQSASFVTSTGTPGKIEIVYLEETPHEYEGPFMAEERDLIDMLADMLRVYFIRREATDALQRSEANLNTVFANTDTIYALLDMNVQLVTYNQRAYDFAKNELNATLQPHTNFITYFSPERQPYIDAHVKNVMQGMHVSYEISYIQQNGTYNWYYVRMFPILDANKLVFGLMMVVSDITEKKLLEQEILNQKVQEQKMVTRAILTGEERERNKIGQELHDNISQIIAGTKLYLGMARKNAEGGENIINASMEFLDNAIEAIRALSKGKVTPMKKVDLHEILQKLIDTFQEATGMTTRFIYNGAGQLIEDDLKLNIYRLIQEQLNNIGKHSMAKNVHISVEAGRDNIRVLVTDDGQGFEVNSKSNGIGINNMINRVEAFNGTIDFTSSPGNGCTIEINLPFKQQAAVG